MNTLKTYTSNISIAFDTGNSSSITQGAENPMVGPGSLEQLKHIIKITKCHTVVVRSHNGANNIGIAFTVNNINEEVVLAFRFKPFWSPDLSNQYILYTKANNAESVSKSSCMIYVDIF